MSDEELEHAKHDGERRAAITRIMMWVSLASLGLNIAGATTFWFALPEKFKNVISMQAATELRVTAVETRSASQEAVLARVDERTKAIQDDVRQLHQDFTFRANGSPILK